jgi:hypothetical protein
MHTSNSIIKFVDNTTVVGLITNNDEAAYGEEVKALAEWCQENNLSLNVNKTKELILDFRKQQKEHAPIHIKGPYWRRWKQAEGASVAFWVTPRPSKGKIQINHHY